MAATDQAMKRLIQAYPAAMLALALPGATFVRLEPTEIAVEGQLLFDSLIRVVYNSDECLVDLEIETYPKKGIARRLGEYGSRAHYATGLTVLSVVIWLTSGGIPEQSPYEMKAGGESFATWRFFSIKLYELAADELFNMGVTELLPLTPFTQGGVSEPNLEKTAHTIAEQSAAEDVPTLETLWAVFAARKIDESVLLSILEGLAMSSDLTELFEQSSLYRRWVSEAQAKGLEQGREQGREEGLADALRIIIERRFGPLTNDVTLALAAGDIATLENATAVAATGALEDVRVALGL
ncbi:MAG TPA: hypothetical protein VMV29_21530 [Ktedonobacterales bacterium]|nr:hypothetical protein [Ktedonobacterales bacterium]